ncbi:MAG: DUF2993 domain-containing protein [Synergistaceae bacterium]|nr:DUF2993 domain-containing protein [Synergistaceae bacterium]
MTRSQKILMSAMIIVLSLSSPGFADEVQDLLDYYVKKFTPENALLVISGKPDSTGMFNDIYMDLQGVVIENLRMDRLTFRMKGVQFNEPSEWAKGKVECKDAIQVNVLSTLLEEDINRAIEAKTFGKGDHWHDVSMAITPAGLKGKGYYKAEAMIMNLDVLLEITSGLKIVKGKELWLNNPVVKANKLDVPDYITKKALTRIQPLVDLRKFPLPMSLHTVNLKNGSAVLSTRVLPKALNKGIKYSYKK